MKEKRVEKFNRLLGEMKEEMKRIEETEGIDVGQWEKDFRRLNPDPQENSELDE